MSIDVMKQALAALENSRSYVELDWVKNQCGRAITALSAAIDEAQPEQDARAHHKMMVAMMQAHWRRIDPQWKDDPELCHAMGYEAGYKDAVARRVEPRESGGSGAGFESLPASPNQPEQEPVAWRWGYRSVTNGEMDWRGYVEKVEHPNLRSPDVIVQPLYTTQRQWQGLTAEEIHEVAGKKWWDWEDLFDIEGFSRAIEAKLKERNT